MSDAEPEVTYLCDRCGAKLASPHAVCGVCNVNPYRAPAPEAAQLSTRFSLATMLGVVTMIAVSLGAGVYSPMLGIGLGVLFTPALLRTGIAMQRRRRNGEDTEWGARLAFFFGSIGLLLMLGAATGVTFYATCWAGFGGGLALFSVTGGQGYGPVFYAFGLGLAAGTVFGLWMLVWLGRKLLRIERLPPKPPTS